MLTVFGNPVSQPTRAVVWLLKLKQFPHTFVNVAVGKDNRTPEYLAKFPSGTIPAIDDNGFYLFESPAILGYLCTKHGWNDLYPTDPQQRARVDQYMHWHHSNVRKASTSAFRPYFMAAFSKGKLAFDKAPIEPALKPWMQIVEAQLSKQAFVAGPTMTIADLLLETELDQLVLFNLFDFTPYPHVRAWQAKMQAVPHYAAVHEGLLAFGKRLSEAMKAAPKL
eukprot:TRINITY_DN499_c0_g1_i1.p2 TRINITY_DN499_c0_g1~~TRINITY_DN499_c0_g1_i1.p2  ORF type:complete len:234 (+),score=47.10 TRINITY_DN499_c0_g1_i1:36-704(+)